MRIGELARRVGLRASAIRYYEQLGILAPPARVSGRREYGVDAVQRLRLVRAAQQAGFTLNEIRTLVRSMNERRSSRTWQDAARTKLVELDASIEQLQAARAALAGALDCECGGDLEVCELVRG